MTIPELHRLYCSLTFQTLALHMGREADWWQFIKAGFTGDDLRCVIGHIQTLNRGRPEAFKTSLRFESLIWHLDVFEGRLSEARAVARKPKPCQDKDSVLKASGRPVSDPNPGRCVPIGEVIKAMRLEVDKA